MKRGRRQAQAGRGMLRLTFGLPRFMFRARQISNIMRRALIFVAVVFVLFSGGSRVSLASSEPPVKPEAPGTPSVYVNGAVAKPGRYDWYKGMTVLDAIQAAGGLTQPGGRQINVLITRAEHSQALFFTFSPGAASLNKGPLINAGDAVYVMEKLNGSPFSPLIPKSTN
jgi:hypothetical protein